MKTLKKVAVFIPTLLLLSFAVDVLGQSTGTAVVSITPSGEGPGVGSPPGSGETPLPTYGIELFISWRQDSITYYPFIDQNYAVNFTVGNNATTIQSVTVQYWLNDGSNETLWNTTYSFLMHAESEVVLTLMYPVWRDGAYTAYAQVVAPNKSPVQTSQFTATSGLPLLIIFFVIIAGAVLVLAYMHTKKRGEIDVQIEL